MIGTETITKLTTPETERTPEIHWRRTDFIAAHETIRHAAYNTEGIDNTGKKYHGVWQSLDDKVIIAVCEDEKTIERFHCSHAGIFSDFDE